MNACLECVYKHLEAAMVIHEDEVFMGYPQHIRRVRGNLHEASRESVALYPKLAELLRAWRKYLLTDELTSIPDYDAILDYVDLLLAIDKDVSMQPITNLESRNPDIPDPPEELWPPKNAEEEVEE